MATTKIFELGLDMIETENALKTKKRYLHIFGTSINSAYKVGLVRSTLSKMSAIKSVNVDLDDWENVLRIECHAQIDPEQLKNTVIGLGFSCYDL